MANLSSIEIIIDGTVRSRIHSGVHLLDVLPLLEGERAVYLVYDRNVEGYARALAAAFPLRACIPVEATEQAKSVDTVVGIDRALLDAGADRTALLLALGGGITTDMAGFAACIYKRGIRFAYIPTTLLAQTDAAIGGKTGVNYLTYKNMLGIIRQPEWTFLCPEVLATLSARDFRSGAAELLKTFIIDNTSGGYERAVALLRERPEEMPEQVGNDGVAVGNDGGGVGQDACTSPPTPIGGLSEDLSELIKDAAAVKAGIVGRDPEEHGERRLLNLGHTFGHAIESLARGTGRDITHGEAVAMGIVLAARLGSPSLAEKLTRDFAACGLPTAAPFSPAEMAAAMRKDKKAEGGIVHFIVPSAIGSVSERDLTVDEAIKILTEE